MLFVVLHVTQRLCSYTVLHITKKECFKKSSEPMKIKRNTLINIQQILDQACPKIQLIIPIHARDYNQSLVIPCNYISLMFVFTCML